MESPLRKASEQGSYMKAKYYLAITQVPPGDAPLWVREKWIGLTLPLAQKVEAPQRWLAGKGVLARESILSQIWSQVIKPNYVLGYLVESAVAVDLLREVHPEAAKWWYENCPHLLHKGRLFIFHDFVGYVTSKEIDEI